MTTPAIRVRDLTKAYRRYSRVRHMLVELFAGIPWHTSYPVLKGLTFDVDRGEVLGIIGSNGAGKSTLLKILAGTLNATSGEVIVNGKISAILELGTGFHPERTGRENVLLGGMCLGMSKAEVERKIEGIIDFSGIREFIDEPFKTYSSGMQARLTFATATAVDPDILIVDEALATGDAMFVSKCMARMRQICESGSTVLLVSHSTALLGQLSDRVMWIERGSIKMLGDPMQVIQAYDLAVHVGSAVGGRVEKSTLTINGRPLDDPEFFPVFERATQLHKVPIWMHPFRPASHADYASETKSEYEIWQVLGWPYETSVAMARIVFSGMFDRLPELRVVTHHCGAMIPYFAGRAETLWAQLGSRSVDSNYDDVLKRMAKSPIDYFKMFYGDTVLGGSASALRCGLDFFGVDKVVFASDCPFDPEHGPMFIREGIRSIESLGLSEQDAQKIFVHNALKLLARRA